MDLPLLTVALIVIAFAAVLLGLAMKPGDWSSIIMVALGAGAIVLGIVAQHSAAEGAVIAGSQRLHAGLIVAILAGLLLLGAGAADAISSRSSRQVADAAPHP